MLKPAKSKSVRANGESFAIVASKYNARYVNVMIRSASAVLKRAGATRIEIIRVPGAFEIPAVAARLAEADSDRFAAIICFGVVFQGETSHAQHIGWGVTHALAQIQVRTKVPVIHGVFIFEKQEQARARCLGKKFNRGTEAAHTALEMARVMSSLRV